MFKRFHQFVPLFGILFFLCIRFYMSISSFYVMGTPRLGDDAYLYLSKGVGFFNNYNHGTKLQKDVDHLIEIQTNKSFEQERQNWRALNQAYGGATFVHDLGVGTLYKFFGRAKLVYLIDEILIALVMALCLYYCSRTLFGQQAAGFSMAVLAPLLLPGQGLHYLVPSTLALSIGLAFIAYSCNQPKPLGTFLFSTVLVFLHNISYVWLASAIVVYFIIEFFCDEKILSKKNLVYFSAAFIPFLVKNILFKTVTFFSLPYASVLKNQPGVWSTFLINFRGFYAYMEGQNIYFFFLLILTATVVIYSFFKDRIKVWIKSIFLILLGVFLVSFFVFVKYYPAEVAVRTFSGFFVFALFLTVFELLRLDHRLKKYFEMSLIVFSVYGSTKFIRYVKNNYDRPYVVNDEEFKTQLHGLDSRFDHLLYFDTEYSFRLGILAGAENFSTTLLPLVDQQEGQSGLGQNLKPTVAIFPVYNELDSALFDLRSNYEKRVFGFKTDMIKKISFARLPNYKVGYLRFISLKNDTHFKLVIANEIKEVAIKANSTVDVEFNSLGSDFDVAFEAPGDGVLYTGLQFDSNNPKLNWPWGTQTHMRMEMTNFSRENFLTFNFSLQAVCESLGRRCLEHPVHLVPISDDSGFVFAKMEWR